MVSRLPEVGKCRCSDPSVFVCFLKPGRVAVVTRGKGKWEQGGGAMWGQEQGGLSAPCTGSHSKFASLQAAAFSSLKKYGVGTCGPRGFYGTFGKCIFSDSLDGWICLSLKLLGSILKCQAVYVHLSFSPVWEHKWDLEGRAVRAQGCTSVIGSVAGVPAHGARNRLLVVHGCCWMKGLTAKDSLCSHGGIHV